MQHIEFNPEAYQELLQALDWYAGSRPMDRSTLARSAAAAGAEPQAGTATTIIPRDMR